MIGNGSAISSAVTSIPAPGTRRSVRDEAEEVKMGRRGRAGVVRGRCGHIEELARRDKGESNLGCGLVVVRGKSSRDEAQRRGVKPSYEPPSLQGSGNSMVPSSSLLRRVNRETKGQRDEEVESWCQGMGQRSRKRGTKQSMATGFELMAPKARKTVVDGSVPVLGDRLKTVIKGEGGCETGGVRERRSGQHHPPNCVAVTEELRRGGDRNPGVGQSHGGVLGAFLRTCARAARSHGTGCIVAW